MTRVKISIEHIDAKELEEWHEQQHKKADNPTTNEVYISGIGTVRPCSICGCLILSSNGIPPRCRHCANS